MDGSMAAASSSLTLILLARAIRARVGEIPTNPGQRHRGSMDYHARRQLVAHRQVTFLATTTEDQRSHPCGVAVRLDSMWLYASALGSREHEGRMSLQNGEGQHKLSLTFLLRVLASHRSFQPINRDFESQRKMPDFALSRRQHGFESRWGYKIK
jgi:hypothetical protein